VTPSRAHARLLAASSTSPMRSDAASSATAPPGTCGLPRRWRQPGRLGRPRPLRTWARTPWVPRRMPPGRLDWPPRTGRMPSARRSPGSLAGCPRRPGPRYDSCRPSARTHLVRSGRGCLPRARSVRSSVISRPDWPTGQPGRPAKSGNTAQTRRGCFRYKVFSCGQCGKSSIHERVLQTTHLPGRPWRSSSARRLIGASGLGLAACRGFAALGASVPALLGASRITGSGRHRTPKRLGKRRGSTAAPRSSRTKRRPAHRHDRKRA
jgi:hypothetical protein